MRFGKEPTPYMDPKIWRRNKTSSEGISYGFGKHTQLIRWQQPTNCLSVIDHFVWLELKGLRCNIQIEKMFM